MLLQELVARLSPRAIKASPADACVVLNTFQGIGWHIQGHSPATALGTGAKPHVVSALTVVTAKHARPSSMGLDGCACMVTLVFQIPRMSEPCLHDDSSRMLPAAVTGELRQKV